MTLVSISDAGTLAPARAATPPGARPVRLSNLSTDVASVYCACVMCGSRPTLAAPAPMPASRGDGWKNPRTAPCSTGSRSPAPTAALRGAGRSGPETRTIVPRALVLPRPLQHQVPTVSCREHVAESHGQPCSRAHRSTSRCPQNAAFAHVHLSHGQSCSRAHLSTSRRPPRAAYAHVCATHGHPLALAQASRSTDVQNSVILCVTTHILLPSTTRLVPARGRSEAVTAARHALPACARKVQRLGSSAEAPSAQRGMGTSRAGRAAARNCCCRRRRRRRCRPRGLPPWAARAAATGARRRCWRMISPTWSCVRRSGGFERARWSGGASLPPSKSFQVGDIVLVAFLSGRQPVPLSDRPGARVEYKNSISPHFPRVGTMSEMRTWVVMPPTHPTHWQLHPLQKTQL